MEAHYFGGGAARDLWDTGSNFQLVGCSTGCTRPWCRGWAAQSSVRRSSKWSGTRHSLDSGMRGMRSVYALPTSLTMVSWCVKVTT